MAPETPTELFDWLLRNQFLSPDRAEELRGTLPTFADKHAFCKELLRRDWLTPYQVNQILQGRAETLVYGPNLVLSRVGEGAMGQVFKAWNVRLGKLVALKTIQQEHLSKGRAMDRFRREIATASQLDHPNIVLVRDADEALGNPYLAMDFIEGIDLARRVKQEGPLPVRLAAEFARQTALGLQHAFERDVVHRDIKPSNLLIAKTASPDQIPVVKILDFGLARFANEPDNSKRLTQAGKILGTIDYIAPEQVDNARGADVRADIYSLGCTLYFLLSGKPPFPGADLVEKLTARISGPLPRIRDARPEVPPGLEDVLLKMMARLPDERYQTPNEVAAALAPYSRAPAGGDAKPILAVAKVVAPAAVSGAPILAAKTVGAVPTMPNVDLGPAPSPAAAPAAEESLGFGDAAVPAAVSATAPRSAPSNGPKRPGQRHPAIFLAGGASVVLVLIFMVRMIGCGAGPEKKGYYTPGAALRLGKVEERTFIDGGSKPNVIEVIREKFRGPVTVVFEDLPPGLSFTPIVIPADKNLGELRLTVSYGTPPFAAKLRIVATAENLRDETTLDFVLKLSPDFRPEKKKR